MTPDAVEREALDLEEEDCDRRRPSYDKALALLERQDRLGAQALRRTIIQRLSEPPTGKLSVHEALIELSRNEKGVRLVTTNFDNRFIEAGLKARDVDAAPKLPIPKPHDWSSLVHLHGRISHSEGADLVLTASDFGRAYLTEQWAARFVTELFREFTVVFVGYSIDDPVMSYMVDALAAEPVAGAQFAKAYAFAGCDVTSEEKGRTRARWRAKNVEPILYERKDGHRLLADTLIEWARIRSDPFLARSQIAINEITKMPAGPNDPVVERVTWALQDPVAAKALADEPPISDEDDFPKLERWLDMFDDRGLLSCRPADTNPTTGDHDATVVRLVDSGLQALNPRTLDQPRLHIARWMAAHLHVPQMLAWVLRNGGHLHSGLRHQVERSLADRKRESPARLRLLWTVLLSTEPPNPWASSWTSERYEAATSEAERRRIEDEVIESIAPRLLLRRGPAPAMQFRVYAENPPRPIEPIDACGHLTLVAGERDTRDQVEEILATPSLLTRHAETLTGYLEQALALAESLAESADDFHPNSSLYRPSIAVRDQNHHQEEWAFLIDLARDGYSALAVADRARGDHLLRRWVLSDQPLFRRLALHALTENPKSHIRLAERLLVAGRRPGVWESELRSEVLRFLRVAGSRLPRSLRVQIVRTIHAGPRRREGRRLPAELIRREKALRLRKLSLSGVRLDKKSRELAQEADSADEGPRTHDEVRWIGAEELAPNRLVLGTVDDVLAAAEDGEISREGYQGLALKRPVKAISALRQLAQRGKWPGTIWEGFLWGFATRMETQRARQGLREYVPRLLSTAPDELFAEVGTAASDLVKDLAEKYGIEREQDLWSLWTRAWSGIGRCPPVISDLSDPLTHALNHPAGKLADAALIRLWKYEPEVGEGLPGPVRPYFEAIGSDPAGRLGRVELVSRLYSLFAIDPDWTKEHLIARLSRGRSEEAMDLWSAFGWSPTVSPDLLQEFREPYLEVLRDSTENLGRGKNLIGLFITICLEAPSQLTPDDIRGVTNAMSEGSLETVLEGLTQRLRGESAERATIWHDKLRPWLQEYWPTAAVRNTARTSRVMLGMLAECGDGFPDAVEWCLRYLRHLEGHGLYCLGENRHVEQHPSSVFQVLDRVVSADALPVHQRPILRGLLDALALAKPDLRSDRRFQLLYQIATG